MCDDVNQKNAMSTYAETERITTLLNAIRNGQDAAKDELCRRVYGELRTIAYQMMPHEEGHTLQPTALVNEVMVRFLDRELLGCFPSRRCFFAVAVQAMHQTLIDHCRARKCLKRGGNRRREPLDAVLRIVEQETESDFEDLHAALTALKQQSPVQHEVVQLRFFGGLTIEQTAQMMGLSTATVKRYWRVARAKLFDALQESAP